VQCPENVFEQVTIPRLVSLVVALGFWGV